LRARGFAATTEDVLTFYLVAVGFGGTLLLATLVLGASGHHTSGDGHAHPLGAHDFNAWLPIGSLRFWTFFLGFGGGVGAILSAQGIAAPAVIGGVAVVIGWVTGVVAVAVVRAMRGTAVDSNVGEPEIIGASGTVIVAVPAGGIGKVRFQSKGRSFDLVAEGEYSAAIPSGASVIVVGRGEDGRVLVSRGAED
jgi:hypothetical protein